MDEMKDPNLKHYKNLSEFFYRELKDGARPVDFDAALVRKPLSIAQNDVTSLSFSLFRADQKDKKSAFLIW